MTQGGGGAASLERNRLSVWLDVLSVSTERRMRRLLLLQSECNQRNRHYGSILRNTMNEEINLRRMGGFCQERGRAEEEAAVLLLLTVMAKAQEHCGTGAR